jgi:purine-binding chemotaxis protein CheW
MTDLLSPETKRWITFSLGQELYAFPLLSVKEVIAPPAITPLPQSVPHFLGITNLRGQVIPILDLRKKLGIKPSGSSETAVVICDLEAHCVGLLVDAIDAVLEPAADKISDTPPLPSTPGGAAPGYVVGVYQHESRLVLLLDLARLLGPADRAAISQGAARAQAA